MNANILTLYSKNILDNTHLSKVVYYGSLRKEVNSHAFYQSVNIFRRPELIYSSFNYKK